MGMELDEMKWFLKDMKHASDDERDLGKIKIKIK
jgi:hypothetical protein